MKKLKISQKLLLGVILQLVLIVLLVADLFYLNNKLNSISKDIVTGTEKNELVKKTTLTIKDFVNDKISYDDLKQNLGSASNYIEDQTRNKISDNIEKIYQLKTEDKEIEKQVMEVTDNSLKQSNEFIQIMSEKLADQNARNKVTTLERLVIGGALVNTNNNYSLKVLFLEMKNDISVKETLLSKLSELNLQTEKDIERLKNTPFLGMAQEASASNKKALELVNQYVANYDKLKQLSDETFDITDNLYQKMNDDSIKTLNTNFKGLKSVFSIVIFILLIASVIIIILNFTLSKIITLVFKQLNIDLKKISDGDLTFSAPEIFMTRSDELGDLARSVEDLLNRLTDIIGNIRNSAGNIAAASQQVSSSSQQLSQGANEQASSVEEVSSTMEEISSNIEQNTENAKTTETISNQAQISINTVAKLSSKALEATKEIASKIDIITDIAFQTNILALNAAVEAARAGEHGKGFAVVAAEVRKLAERSRQAAEDIVRLSKESYTLAEDAGTKMNNTLPEIDKTTNLVKEITAASIEQSNGVNQINMAMQQLNNVTQQNASSSEELAASSEEMTSQADLLKELVAYFKLLERRNR